MNQPLTIQDIDTNIREKVSGQAYARQTIEGVQIMDLKKHTTEDGTFTEILRITDGKVQNFPEITITQINRSVMLPQTIKAWHLHYNQDEIWNLAAGSHLILGLWDVREQSTTKNLSIKIPLTSSRLVFIPRGVAHGAANISGKHAEILYFVSQQYNPDSPDEQRLPWDSLGKEFWEAKKE